MKHREWTVRNITFGKEDSYPVCVSFMPETPSEMEKTAEDYRKAAPDLIEWRMDYLTDLSRRIEKAEMPKLVKRVRACFPETVLLLTCRTAKEGGRAVLSDERYREMIRQILKDAAEDFDLLDVEYAKKDTLDYELLSEASRKGLVFSFHDFSETPDNDFLEEKLRSMVRDGAGIAKVAVMPRTKEDVDRLLSLTRKVDTELDGQGLLMTISMGSMGTVSRIEGRKYGSVFTFAGLSSGAVSAPGQISIRELREKLDRKSASEEE